MSITINLSEAVEKITATIVDGEETITATINELPRGVAGPTGPEGPAGPNSVTSATTSNGTAELTIASLSSSGSILCTGIEGSIEATGDNAIIAVTGAGSAIIASGSGSYIETSGTYRIINSGAVATLSATLTANRAIAFPDGSGTLAFGSGTNGAIVSADVTDASSGATDESVVNVAAKFGANGELSAATFYANSLNVQPGGSIILTSTNSGGLIVLTGESATSARSIAFPDASGTVALTSSNVATATALQTARTIFGQSFNGSADVNGNLLTNGHLASVPSGGAAGHLVTLNGTAPTVVAGRCAWWSDGSGVPSFRNGAGSVVALNAAGTLTGTTLASNVVTSSLTSVGTLSTLAVSGVLTTGTYNTAGAAGLRFDPIAQTLSLSRSTGGTVLVNFNLSSNTYDFLGTIFSGNGITTSNLGVVRWSSSGTAQSGSYDTGISRKTSSPGVIRIGNGTTNDATGSIECASITLGTPLAAGSGGTGLTSLGPGIATFLGTPTSANLAAAVTDETGSGSLVFATSPTLVTPLLGTPTSGTLTNCTGYPELALAGVVRAVATTDLVRAAGVSGADSVLTVALVSGKSYRVRGMVKLVGQTGGTLYSNLGGPNCTLENVLAIRPGFTFNAGASSLTPYTSLGLHNATGATIQQVMFDGVINTSSAGNFVFSWGSTGASATRAAGSYIEATLLN